MSTPARVRRLLDFNRLRQAVSGPGIDPRSWVELGRVDDDPDAITWLPGTGWTVDVTFVTGELAEEDEVPCQVSSAIGGALSGSFAPIKPGCPVVVLMPAGNPNVSPTIIGVLHAVDDCQVPVEINLLPVTEQVMLDNVVVKSGDSLEVEFAGDAHVQAPAWWLIGERINLAPLTPRSDATEPFIRGNQYGVALNAFLTSVETFSSAVSTASTTLAGLTAAAASEATGLGAPGMASAWTGVGTFATALSSACAALGTAAGTFKATIADYPTGWKSTRIAGE